MDICVGPEGEEILFRVHKQIICGKIPYFDKMFNGGFQEAKERVAKLPEDDPASFDVLIEWVYSPNPQQIRQLEQVKTSDDAGAASWNVLSLYSLLEKLCLPDLQDLVMDAFIKYQRKVNVGKSHHSHKILY